MGYEAIIGLTLNIVTVIVIVAMFVERLRGGQSTLSGRVAALEAWKSEHLGWADAKLAESASQYVRRDVLSPQLEAIDHRLRSIEGKLDRINGYGGHLS